jgi:hypothetical protein
MVINVFYAIIAILIIFLIALGILFYMNNEKNKKSKELKKTGQNTKKEKKEDIVSFDKKVRNFFRRYLNEKSEMNYSEISEKLKIKNKHDLAKFCDNMNYCLYSGSEIKEPELENLKKQYNQIIKKHRIK